MKTILLACLLTILLLPIAAQGQSYYKWRDDQGTTHFTSEPPLDRDYEIVDTRGNVVGRSAPTVPDQPEARSDSMPLPREGAPDPEEVARRCRQARENMVALTGNRRIVMERDDGSEVLLTEDERQEQIERNQAILDQWCADQAQG